MSDKISFELGPLQSTLFMPLWARAKETKKEIPIAYRL